MKINITGDFCIIPQYLDEKSALLIEPNNLEQLDRVLKVV